MNPNTIARFIRACGINVQAVEASEEMTDAAVYISETVHVQVGGKYLIVHRFDAANECFHVGAVRRDLDSMLADLRAAIEADSAVAA